MPTDDERREAAANIRNAANRVKDDLQDDPDYTPLAALYVVSCGIRRGLPHYKDLLHLADLIEPEPERTCHNDLKDSDYGGVWPIPHFKCSSCGGLFASYEFDYCPNCGAKVVSE